MSMSPETGRPHTRLEDAYALTVGCIMLALGIAILKAAGLVTGGMAGLALLAGQFLPVSPGFLFALLNVPFFILSMRTMGMTFTFKTLIVSIGVAGFSLLFDHTADFTIHNAALAAFASGIILGLGTLAIARHGAGVGGVGIVALWLLATRQWNAGRTQVILDIFILGASIRFLGPTAIAYSVIGAVAMGSIVYLWHRPELYSGISPPFRTARDDR
ncbi:YitT family protein [Altericroceibacterium spongiae]|uniref:YitT family protein n=1 Tax=Altericroceibacterium spongiae TaxID=2320269 RepID=A0A420EPH9_9SPHN|nr:YitT family protein [Altericroceibacterium spongiae]RKF22577.1 YitT family protein [Altericroceibacterium spongiae]